MKTARLLTVAAVLALGATQATLAQEFRAFRPIAAPGARTALPAGARPLATPFPIERRQIEEIVRGLLDKWNTPDMASILAENFYNRSRLVDALAAYTPRDARLRLLSVQGIQVLDQYATTDAEGRIETVVSRVSATVRAQQEFNDPVLGFRRLEGVNEFIIRIIHGVRQ